MIKHHILLAYRNFIKHKSSFFINLIGLSTGLACALMIYLWVNDELSFDKFHKKDMQLYQVMELSKENNNVIVHDGTQGPLADAMKKDLPEIESSVLVFALSKEGLQFNVKTTDKTVKAAGIFAGKDFFNIFSFPLKSGNATQVLTDKNSMVISETLAKSLFGTSNNAVGKSLEYEIMGMKKQVQVSGVFNNLPINNSMQFDFALTQESLVNDLWKNGQQWWNEGPATYLVLKEGTDIDKFNKKIKDFIKPYFKETQFSLFVRPYSSSYLFGNYENGIQSGGRIAYVKLFSFIALFILLIACINFMNLSTARASRRLKEVGIKKVLGSSRKTLILQFISEAVFMSFLSLILAGFIVVLFMPVFNQITGKEIAVQLNLNLVLIIVSVTFLTGVLSGSYPAFYLSSFNPVAVLKGKIKNSVGEIIARKGLVVFQFVVSLVLIVSVMVIYKQVYFIQSKNLGYNKDNIIYFDKEGTVEQNSDAFLAELKKNPNILNASAIQQNVVQNGHNNSTYGIDWPGKTKNEVVNFIVRNVDYDLIETLGIQIKEGRSFSKQFGSDSSKLIFNETAIKIMGLKDPIGTKLRMWDEDVQIVGVVKDFHISSLHEPILPMVFRYNHDKASMIMAKIKAGKERETIADLEKFYKKYNQGYLFDYKFLDNTFQAQYVSEQRVSTLSKYFAVLTILISCLGLFGLAAFNAESKTKEIGIRKVLGATASSVMYLLSKDFFKLIIIAALIAFPLAWWAMNNWLSDFAYKIKIGADVFFIAFAAMVMLTFITISFQAIKAAIANPVKSLRTE